MTTNGDRWATVRKMVDEAHEALIEYIDANTTDDAVDRVLPKPPTVLDLLWNKRSPWPFPTQGKPAPLTRVKYITFHHSAGHRNTTNIKYWNQLHTQTKRWPHIGYHFAVAALERGGPTDLFQCNRIGEFTWHDSRNHDTVGVCVSGDLRRGYDDSPTSEQVQLTGRLLAWLIPQLPNFIGITTHKKIQSTACPGDIERWGSKIVEAAAAYNLDIEPYFNVRPGKAVRSRAMGMLRRMPSSADYGDV